VRSQRDRRRRTFTDSGTIMAAFACQLPGAHHFLTNHHKVDS
jgi:hypothetical protein